MLFAVLALAVGPVAARAHAYAAALLGADVCTTTEGGSPPPASLHADHCQCCNGTPLGPPWAASGGSAILPSGVPRADLPLEVPRAMRVAAARPRGPPGLSVPTH